MAHYSSVVDHDIDAPLLFDHTCDDVVDIRVGGHVEGTPLDSGMGETLHSLESAGRSVYFASLRSELVTTEEQRDSELVYTTRSATQLVGCTVGLALEPWIVGTRIAECDRLT